MMSVLGLVYSGGSFAPASASQMASPMMETDHHTRASQATRYEALPCQSCPAMQDGHQMHCGAPMLVLSSESVVHRPVPFYDVPVHNARDLIAHIFILDPPPPRIA
jgi:hypothetical protein